MLTKTLGIFDGIVDGFKAIFKPIIEWLANTIGGFLDAIFYEVLKLAYGLLKFFYLIIDFVQLVFRKLAGLDSYMMEGSSEIMTGDITLMILRSDEILNVLFAFLAIAVILLFITTFIAIIKNQYDTWDGKVTVGKIIGLSLKALFSFIFVPVICYFGIFVSNGLLQTVDLATRASNALTISGEVFAASACDANKILISDSFWEEFVQDPELNMNGALMQGAVGDTGKQRIIAARNVDNAFASLTATNNSGMGFSTFDYKNTDTVMKYYDLKKFNWLLGFLACFFITAALIVASMGVIQRLFELAILFVVGPPMMALMPIDKGNAFKKWRTLFIEKTIIMYGTVIAINFFFILVPIFQRISLFTTADALIYTETGVYLFNKLVRILFILCGALVIKDSARMLTTVITANDKTSDTFSSGSALMGGLGKINQSMRKTAQNVYGGAKKLAGHFGRDKDENGENSDGNGGSGGAGGSAGAGGSGGMGGNDGGSGGSSGGRLSALKQRMADRSNNASMSERLGSGMASLSNFGSSVKRVGDADAWRSAGGTLKTKVSDAGSSTRSTAGRLKNAPLNSVNKMRANASIKKENFKKGVGTGYNNRKAEIELNANAKTNKKIVQETAKRLENEKKVKGSLTKNEIKIKELQERLNKEDIKKNKNELNDLF